MKHPTRRPARALIFLCAQLLSFTSLVAAEPPKLTPFKPSGIYELGEKAGWSVELPGGAAAAAAPFHYELKKNGAIVLQSGTLDPASGPARIETTLDEPAMLYLEVRASDDDNSPCVAGAAIAPTSLAPCTPRPADFDTFWEAKLKALEAVPAEPVLTRGDSGKEGVEYATVRLNNINGAHVYGQLARPATPDKLPAVLLLQWAGGPYPLQKEWVTTRAAEGWLALNIEPHDVPGDMPQDFYAALPALIKHYYTIYNDDRDRNYFLQMYLGAYRAIDYLAGRPDWDGKTLLVMGTSMGGQQSLAVAGLHPRITHLIVHVPAGGDANATLHGHAPAYPNWDSNNPDVATTAPYFDTVNFASRIRARCLVSMGFVDQICPPTTIWVAFNQIAGPKEVVPLVDAPHNHQATDEQQRAYTERANAWLAALVRGDEPGTRPLVAARD